MISIKIKIAWIVRRTRGRRAFERYQRDQLKRVTNLSAFYGIKITIIYQPKDHPSQRSARRIFKDFTAIPGIEKEENIHLYDYFMRQRLDRIIMFCDIENKISSLFHEYLANGDNRDDMLSQSVSKLSPSDAINMLTVFNILRNKMYKM